MLYVSKSVSGRSDQFAANATCNVDVTDVRPNCVVVVVHHGWLLLLVVVMMVVSLMLFCK